MRASIVNPYLDTLGGGERYTISFARVLADSGWEVDVEWKEDSILEKLENRFGLKTKGINIVSDVKRGDGYDLCFWISDGSIPTLHARKNILHFQFPFTKVDGKSLINKMKLIRISKIICNSNFTKRFIDKEYGVESIVLYPPVDVESIKPKRKENIILSVGRFSQLTQVKNQDILVSVFKRLVQGVAPYKNWKLVLAGGSEVGGREYVKKLEKLSKGVPIEIIENPRYDALIDLYGRAKIFWSATGYGVDENKEPLRVEHFGITAVEAMAGGVVPIVVCAGGHKETVDTNSGYLWHSTRELLVFTKKLINDNGLIRKKSVASKEASKKFSYERFKQQIIKLL